MGAQAKRPPHQTVLLTSIPWKTGSFSKEANFEGSREEQNDTFANTPPLDSVQPADPWEAAVRSSPGANPGLRTGRSGALPDFLFHHTGDDMGHPVLSQNCQTFFFSFCKQTADIFQLLGCLL